MASAPPPPVHLVASASTASRPHPPHSVIHRHTDGDDEGGRGCGRHNRLPHNVGDGGCRSVPLPSPQSDPLIPFVLCSALRLLASSYQTNHDAQKYVCEVLLLQHLRQPAGSSPRFGAGENKNLYKILGITLFDGFDQMKMAYKRKRGDAEISCNQEYLVKVSKDIRYADDQPVVPWGPRYSRSTVKDLRINMTISAAFLMFISILGHADWKPLQFMCFVYFYRMLEKLKATELAIAPIYNGYGEVEGRGIHMAKRVLRSLGLVLGSILATSLGYTGLVNFSQFLGQYIPSVLYNFQELIVTTASSVLLCILASYYR